MKSYKKAKVVAMNAPVGSYAAGCPEKLGTCYYFCETKK